jgi:hypothetical protein
MRVIAIGLTFTCLVTELFDKIRENIKNNVTIRLRMLSILETIASQSTFRACAFYFVYKRIGHA